MQPDNKMKPWQDKETLRELYVDKRMSTIKIAEHFDNDITDAGVRYWLNKHDIEIRSRSEAGSNYWRNVPIKQVTDFVLSYEKIDHSYKDDRGEVLMHRLLAVAKFGFDEVEGKVVHHKSGVEWDNRWSNIDIMTEEEHAQLHGTGRHDDEPWHDVELLRELRVEQGLTLGEMADHLGCSDTTVWRSLREHRIEGGDEEAAV